MMAYDNENKCGPRDRVNDFLSNGSNFRLQTNFCTELKQFLFKSDGYNVYIEQQPAN